ncbi:hypothetical protein VNO77_03122 [Canavalia gladiata]|uniref:Uncharacterized protein n=1 Tax=Canavalia gladiata TaxID=3824 RepID=A0AAN9MU72_CANGL
MHDVTKVEPRPNPSNDAPHLSPRRCDFDHVFKLQPMAFHVLPWGGSSFAMLYHSLRTNMVWVAITLQLIRLNSDYTRLDGIHAQSLRAGERGEVRHSFMKQLGGMSALLLFPFLLVWGNFMVKLVIKHPRRQGRLQGKSLGTMCLEIGRARDQGELGPEAALFTLPMFLLVFVNVSCLIGGCRSREASGTATSRIIIIIFQGAEPPRPLLGHGLCHPCFYSTLLLASLASFTADGACTVEMSQGWRSGANVVRWMGFVGAVWFTQRNVTYSVLW